MNYFTTSNINRCISCDVHIEEIKVLKGAIDRYDDFQIECEAKRDESESQMKLYEDKLWECKKG